jgi:hypothetical protein
MTLAWTGISVRVESLAVFLLTAMMLCPLLPSPEAASVAATGILVAWVLLFGGAIPRRIVYYSMPLVLLIAVGALGMAGHATRDIVRDIWYMSKPIPFLALGYLLARHVREPRRLLEAIVLAGGLTGALHLSEFVRDPSILSLPLDALRHTAGLGYVLTVAGMALMAGSRHLGFVLFPGRKLLAHTLLVLCMLSFIMSFSRTMLLALLVLLPAVYGLLEISRWRRRAGQASRFNVRRAVLVGVAAVAVLVGVAQTEPGQQVAMKLGRSLTEVAVRSYTSWFDIHMNWRGYEAFRAMQTYFAGSTLERFVGLGHGALVDLKLSIKLIPDEPPFRHMAVLHNGYAYLLVKTGLVGVALYLLFLARLAISGSRLRHEADPATVLAGRMVIGLAIAIAAMTTTGNGVLQTGMNEVVIAMGMVLSLERRRVHPGEPPPEDRVRE